MDNVSPEKLKIYCKRILEAHLIPENESEVIADSLLDANLDGVDSHGVTRLSTYLVRLRNQIIESETKMEVVKEYMATSLLDANNGWGQVAGKFAMEHAI